MHALALSASRGGDVSIRHMLAHVIQPASHCPIFSPIAYPALHCLPRPQDRAAGMSRRTTGEFRSRVEALQRQHTDLSHKLLHVMRCVDALESRLALSAGWVGVRGRRGKLCHYVAMWL